MVWGLQFQPRYLMCKGTVVPIPLLLLLLIETSLDSIAALWIMILLGPDQVPVTVDWWARDMDLSIVMKTSSLGEAGEVFHGGPT